MSSLLPSRLMLCYCTLQLRVYSNATAGYGASDSESAMTSGDDQSNNGPFSHPQAGNHYSYTPSANTPTAEMPSFNNGMNAGGGGEKSDLYPSWNEVGGHPVPLSREEIEDIFDDVRPSSFLLLYPLSFPSIFLLG